MKCYAIDFSHEATTDPASFRDTIKLAPMPDSYDLDRGLLLSVQAIQVCSVISSWEIVSVTSCFLFKKLLVVSKIYTYFLNICQALLENKGLPVIVGIGNELTQSVSFPLYPHD